jgi:hypothetical protein
MADATVHLDRIVAPVHVVMAMTLPGATSVIRG